MATPYRLGRTLWHDSKSLQYPARTTAIKTVKHRHYGPVLDQGNLGSCTGNSISQVLNTAHAHKTGHKLYTEKDAINFYHRGTLVDEFTGDYPPDDSGSSGNGVCLAALQDGVLASYDHAFGIDHALGALSLQPVMIGINWYNSMFDPDSNGFLTIANGIAGGHEPCLVGINLKGEFVWLLNSWGASWALKGFAKLRFADLDRLLQEDGDVTVPVAA
jgi:hypothetical protein